MGGPVDILLLSMLLPLTTPVAAQTSEDSASSPCNGDPSADYNGECGPSVTFPAWSDLNGWDNNCLGEVIRLIGLNGDGKAELVGNGPRGLEVYRFSSESGQWVPAYDAGKPLPFPNPAAGGIRLGSIDFGWLADNLWGAIGLKSDGSGIQTWSCNPGDGTIATARLSTMRRAVCATTAELRVVRLGARPSYPRNVVSLSQITLLSQRVSNVVRSTETTQCQRSLAKNIQPSEAACYGHLCACFVRG
jgi:hypothetical protein